MPQIVFMYKLFNEICHGKFLLEYLSDDYEGGVDLQIYDTVLNCINKYLKKNNLDTLNKIDLGIINVLSDKYFS